MPPARAAARFGVRFILVYALLIAPWPGARAAQGAVFRAVAGLTFGHLPAGRTASFEPTDAPEGRERRDTSIVFVDPAGAEFHRTRVNSLHLIWLPAATFAALLAAGPSGRRRRLLAIGLPLIAMFLALRAGLVVFDELTDGLPQVGEAYPRLEAILWRARKVAVDIPSIWFVVPIAVWALAAIRREDWAAWFPAEAPDAQGR